MKNITPEEIIFLHLKAIEFYDLSNCEDSNILLDAKTFKLFQVKDFYIELNYSDKYLDEFFNNFNTKDDNISGYLSLNNNHFFKDFFDNKFKNISNNFNEKFNIDYEKVKLKMQ